jgi:hypothetical protein
MLINRESSTNTNLRWMNIILEHSEMDLMDLCHYVTSKLDVGKINDEVFQKISDALLISTDVDTIN